MSKDSKFRGNLTERDILALSDNQVRKLERVNESLENVENAEANKEAQRKLRVLFERAPEETLPFLVYCIYVAAAGLSSFFYLISKFEGDILYYLLGFLCFILVVPLVLIPKLHIKKLFSWVFEVKKTKQTISSHSNDKRQ